MAFNNLKSALVGIICLFFLGGCWEQVDHISITAKGDIAFETLLTIEDSAKEFGVADIDGFTSERIKDLEVKGWKIEKEWISESRPYRLKIKGAGSLDNVAQISDFYKLTKVNDELYHIRFLSPKGVNGKITRKILLNNEESAENAFILDSKGNEIRSISNVNEDDLYVIALTKQMAEKPVFESVKEKDMSDEELIKMAIENYITCYLDGNFEELITYDSIKFSRIINEVRNLPQQLQEKETKKQFEAEVLSLKDIEKKKTAISIGKWESDRLILSGIFGEYIDTMFAILHPNMKYELMEIRKDQLGKGELSAKEYGAMAFVRFYYFSSNTAPRMDHLYTTTHPKYIKSGIIKVYLDKWSNDRTGWKGYKINYFELTKNEIEFFDREDEQRQKIKKEIDIKNCKFDTTLWVPLNKGEKKDDFYFSKDGHLYYQDMPIASALTAGYLNSKAIAAEKVLISPLSPSKKYLFIKTCDNNDNCYNLNLIDVRKKTLKPTFAGKYGPKEEICWAPDERLATFKYYDEGQLLYYQIDLVTASTFDPLTNTSDESENNASAKRDQIETQISNVGKLLNSKKYAEADKLLSNIERDYPNLSVEDVSMASIRAAAEYRVILDQQLKAPGDIGKESFYLDGVVTMKSPKEGSGGFWGFKLMTKDGIEYNFLCSSSHPLRFQLDKANIDPGQGYEMLKDTYANVRLIIPKEHYDYVINKCNNKDCNGISPAMIIMSSIEPQKSQPHDKNIVSKNSADIGQSMDECMRLALDTIRKNWKNPAAKNKKQTATAAVIDITVKKDGKISNVWFKQQSNIQAINDAAWKAIKKSDPLPALPGEYPESTRQLTISFSDNGVLDVSQDSTK